MNFKGDFFLGHPVGKGPLYLTLLLQYKKFIVTVTKTGAGRNFILESTHCILKREKIFVLKYIDDTSCC